MIRNQDGAEQEGEGSGEESREESGCKGKRGSGLLDDHEHDDYHGDC